MRLYLLLTIITPSLLLAQARCTDSLVGASWRQTPLIAAVTAPVPGTRDRDRYVATILGKMAEAYRDPRAALMAPGATVVVTPLEERTRISATLELGVDRNGKVALVQVRQGSGDAALDSALISALRTADGGRGFGKVPRKVAGDTVRFTVVVTDRDPPPGGVPVGAIASAYRVADVAPRLRSMPPARGTRAQHGHEIVLAGTVTTAGRVLPGSVRVVSTNDSTLIPIARRSFERATFRAGTLNGCPAESYIRQVFRFP